MMKMLDVVTITFVYYSITPQGSDRLRLTWLLHRQHYYLFLLRCLHAGPNIFFYRKLNQS